MRYQSIFLYALVFLPLTIAAQEYLERYESLDVTRYRIELEINDTTDSVRGNAEIDILLKKPAGGVTLDLASADKEGKGMRVDSVFINGAKTEFTHRENRLILPVENADQGIIINFKLYYKGSPGGGLTIAENMYGERTFFTDNWPDRAHHWFPCVDHPSDRALVDFTITAPSHYQVIATGTLQMKVNMPGRRTTHFWSSSVSLPVKVMGFAAAGFAVQYLDDIDGIPWSNWVYPQNMEEGFRDFSVTPEILRFFAGMIAPYPFEKIANVQSTIPYGGMENAGNIFYHERSVSGDRTIKYTMVHEMAHQWFGNSVTEQDWPHLWLSEGIATWLTNRYLEQESGYESYREKLITQRERVIEYSRSGLAPVVDHHAENITDLLNPNVYDKGAWILHMLRRKIGEENLVSALTEFYDRYRLGHACTDDFMKVIEDVSGADMEQFFDDWLYSAGHPVLAVSTRFGNGRLTMELLQVQQHKMAFIFPLDIRFVFEDGTKQDHTFDIFFRRHEFIFEMDSEPAEIILDPEIWLLFEQR